MRALIAIGVSLLVHLILAACLWWYFAARPASVVLAQLDLTSVELSLAEDEAETAAPAASLPSAAAPPAAPRPPERPALHEPRPEISDPSVPALAEPTPPAERLPPPELPEAKRPPERRPPSESSARATPAPAAAPKQAKVDAPPKPKRTIRPDYPRGSRLRKEEGDVVLEIHVDASGAVSGVRVVVGSGFAELDEAAVRAAREARFTPAKSGRDAVASVARLRLTFRLK